MDEPTRYEANFTVSVKSLNLSYTGVATVVIGGELTTAIPVNTTSKNNIELKVEGIQPHISRVDNLTQATEWVMVHLATILYSPRRQLKFKPSFKWNIVK